MSFKDLANAVRDTFMLSTPLSLSDITSLLPSVSTKSSSVFIDLVSKKTSFVVVPSNITTIGVYAFANNSNLTDVFIRDNVTTIGDYSFSDCTALSTIIIPNSVQNIGNNAFIGCTALTDVYCDFEEGTVAGAPWGASANVVIHYKPEPNIILEHYARIAEEAATVASTNADEVNPYVNMMEELKQQVS